MNLNLKKHTFVCPECGSREIHVEYGSYGCNLLLRVCQETVEDVSDEELWCYCQSCGLVFDPAAQDLAVSA